MQAGPKFPVIKTSSIIQDSFGELVSKVILILKLAEEGSEVIVAVVMAVAPVVIAPVPVVIKLE